jgi:steroid 5-alpha reductase family enzyme
MPANEVRLESPGITLMGFFELYAIALLVVLLMVSALWAISVPLRDASIIDMFWGPLFVAIAWVLLPLSGPMAFKPYLVTLLVTLWGLRLGFHLVSRNLGAGEDRRYQLWRQHGGDNWWLVSYYRIYLFQGAIAMVVATPLIATFYRPEGFGLIAAVGVLLWGFGFVYELLADIQLARFKAEPANRGSIMNEGLWAHSRHPNYFGDALQWWGLGLIAFSVATWWALIGPAVMTAVFLGISNDVLERGMQKRHPEYAAYIAETPKFFPRLRRASRQAAS